MKILLITLVLLTRTLYAVEVVPENAIFSRVVIPIIGADDLLFKFKGELKYKCLNGIDFKVHYLTIDNDGKENVIAIFNGLHPRNFDEHKIIGKKTVKLSGQDIEFIIRIEDGKKFAVGNMEFGKQIGTNDKTGENEPIDRANVLQVILNIRDEAEIDGVINNIRMGKYVNGCTNSNQSLKGRM